MADAPTTEARRTKLRRCLTGVDPNHHDPPKA